MPFGPFSKSRLPSLQRRLTRRSDQVRIKLAADPIVKGGAIGVSVRGGVVDLTGKVTSVNAKMRAEKITKKVKGVKAVDNKLTVEFGR